MNPYYERLILTVVKPCRMWRLFWSVVGVAVMYYELIEDRKMEEAEKSGISDHSPTCDIGNVGFAQFTKEVSCSKIFKSKYAKGFGFLDKVF